MDYKPLIGKSKRLLCCLRHIGTNAVISWWPRARNQSMQILRPRQEKYSLFPWLKNIKKKLINLFAIKLFSVYNSQ